MKRSLKAAVPALFPARDARLWLCLSFAVALLVAATSRADDGASDYDRMEAQRVQDDPALPAGVSPTPSAGDAAVPEDVGYGHGADEDEPSAPSQSAPRSYAQATPTPEAWDGDVNDYPYKSVDDFKPLDDFSDADSFEAACDGYQEECLGDTYGGSGGIPCLLLGGLWRRENGIQYRRLDAGLAPEARALLRRAQERWDASDASDDALNTALNARIRDADGSMYRLEAAQDWDTYEAGRFKARALLWRSWVGLKPAAPGGPAPSSVAHLDADQALGSAYATLLAAIPDGQKPLLRASERDWLRARDAVLALGSGFADASAAGRAAVQMAAERTRVLGDWYGTAREDPDSDEDVIDDTLKGFKPMGLAVSPSGALFVADRDNHCVREIADGGSEVVAGTGGPGSAGDGGLAASAQLDLPLGVAADGSGDLFIADTGNHRVREVVKATGAIVTVAGGAQGAPLRDGWPAVEAPLRGPAGLAVDAEGDLFIADRDDQRVREVLKDSGRIVTIAGTGTAGWAGDGGYAFDAELDAPVGVAVDPAGDVFIADSSNDRVREVLKAGGNIVTVAGDGVRGYAGDGGPAAAAELDTPVDVAVDAAGDLYIADMGNNRVREVLKSGGTIVTLAGDGLPEDGADKGPAALAGVDRPSGLALDRAGNLYISESDSGRVREVLKADGSIRTLIEGSSF